MRTALVMFALLAAGCATTQLPIPPIKLEAPSKRVMVAPETLGPAPKAGDDLFDLHADLRAKYGRETGKLKALQSYVRKIRKDATK